MNFPKISLVIPTYNAEATIEKAIKSIISQDYPNLELIFIDGNSHDNTVTIAKNYESYFEHFICEPDQGQANALNKGFKLATGEIWGWLCADDELAPHALHYAATTFTERPEVNLVTGKCRRMFDDGTEIETTPIPDVMERISYHNGIEQPSTFWRSSLHKKTGELDETMNYAFDWDWWNRLKLAGANIYIIPEIMSMYYFSDTNKTSTGSRKLVKEMYRVIKRYGPLKGYLADIYMFLYLNFDLYGCYDQPSSASKWRQRIYYFVIERLTQWFDKEIIYWYNWNFASKQERGLCWYK